MENNSSIIENASDFFHYLVEKGGVNRHTRKNYMSWLSFLSKHYKIDNTINTDYIDHILTTENKERLNRNIYTKEKDLINFASALRKYKAFIESNYEIKKEREIRLEISNIDNDKTLKNTEKTAIIQSRLGQGVFRNKLIEYWHGCSISSFKKSEILVASHIKPWKNSNNEERLDMYNGLLLLPNYDKLFDKGYISFDDEGQILISKYLTEEDKCILNINSNICLTRIEEEHKKYMHYHNENCFIR